jgi:hypothetical protein
MYKAITPQLDTHNIASAHGVHPAKRIRALLLLQPRQRLVQLQRHWGRFPRLAILLSFTVVRQGPHRGKHHSGSCGEQLVGFHGFLHSDGGFLHGVAPGAGQLDDRATGDAWQNGAL